ncbi:MAG: DUF6817 domain-containing protein [Pseudomonadota bacterium]
MSYAPHQNLIGLLCTLRGQGGSDALLKEVVTWHDFALDLFFGRIRKCQRPFICHAVGATDATAHFVTIEKDILAASMFHSAYRIGQFPKNNKRAALRKVIGDRAEMLVHTYSDVSPKDLSAIIQMSSDNEQLLAGAWLAHEYEEHLLSPVAGHRGRVFGETDIRKYAKVSRKLGFNALADAWMDVIPATSDTAWIGEILGNRGSRRLRTQTRGRILARRLVDSIQKAVSK